MPAFDVSRGMVGVTLSQRTKVDDPLDADRLSRVCENLGRAHLNLVEVVLLSQGVDQVEGYVASLQCSF